MQDHTRFQVKHQHTVDSTKQGIIQNQQHPAHHMAGCNWGYDKKLMWVWLGPDSTPIKLLTVRYPWPNLCLYGMSYAKIHLKSTRK